MDGMDEVLEYDYMFKLLVIGDSNVGKSSILSRFVDDTFTEDSREYSCTIGVDFFSKIVNINGKKVYLVIWDTAGQERFRSITSSYYRGADGVILVYDVCAMESFKNLDYWLEQIVFNSTNIECVKVLMGNKIDKKDIMVSTSVGTDYARNNNLLFVETSSKHKMEIDAIFEELAEHLLQHNKTQNTSKFLQFTQTVTNLCFC